MTRFDNQTVLVTGVTGGQGSSHVRAFHAEGANVAIGGIDAESGAALADELGTRAHFTRLTSPTKARGPPLCKPPRAPSAP